MVGTKFYKWTVIDDSFKDKWGSYSFKCRCECGHESIVRRCDLLQRKSLQCRDCGYKYKRNGIPKEKSPLADKGNNFRHGFSRRKTYDAWSHMLYRCKSDGKDSKWYKDRGITVSDRWSLFSNFLEDMGECPKGKMLDRIDNNKGYFKDNCRWVTPLISSRNRRNVKAVFRDDLPDWR